jgi:hypothetical protein
VLAQNSLEQAEVLLFDFEHDQFPPLPGSSHPNIRTFHVQAGKSLKNVRYEAVQTAKGKAIAFIEEHATVNPGWLNAMIRNFQRGYAGVGGPAKAINPHHGISDLVSIMNYYKFSPSSVPQTSKLLPGHNSAYLREPLLEIGNGLMDLLSSEVLLNWHLISNGHTLLLDNDAGFNHLNEENFSGIFWGYYYWNISFGASRSKYYRWSWPRRFAQAALIPIIPFIRYAKMLRDRRKNNPAQARVLLRFTFYCLAAQFAAASGLAIGCIFGEGDADMKMNYYELYDPRVINS